MKKLLLLALPLFCMTACVDAQSQPGGSTGRASILVVYFSWSGNTRRVADIIADLTGCDIVEIEVLEPYSSVYNEVTARARQELDNDVRPELKTRVEDMDEYDTLIVGTPIWSSRLAPAVKSFLASYDLSGKNIAPFCTHGGSGTAQSVNNIRSVCPHSTILQSLAISGSRAGNSRNDVERWLRTINIIK
jgi:flavodoxin